MTQCTYCWGPHRYKDCAHNPESHASKRPMSAGLSYNEFAAFKKKIKEEFVHLSIGCANDIEKITSNDGRYRIIDDQYYSWEAEKPNGEPITLIVKDLLPKIFRLAEAQLDETNFSLFKKRVKDEFVFLSIGCVNDIRFRDMILKSIKKFHYENGKMEKLIPIDVVVSIMNDLILELGNIVETKFDETDITGY